MKKTVQHGKERASAGKIDAILKFLDENPMENNSVFHAVILYLERGDIQAAKFKIKLDSDKFLDRKKVLSFFSSVDLT